MFPLKMGMENLSQQFNHMPKACRKWGENFRLEKVAPMYEKYFRDVLDVYEGKGWYAEGNGLYAGMRNYP